MKSESSEGGAMSKLRAPYQCLERAGKFLVAARGSNIDLFSLEHLSLLASWRGSTVQDLGAKDATQSVARNPAANTSEAPAQQDTEVSQLSPPAKRRKLSDEGASHKVEEREKESKQKYNNRSDSVASGLEAPAVVALTATRQGQHVIAVTGEDKTIRVFEIAVKEDGNYHLKSLSRRCVRKRSAFTLKQSEGLAANFRVEPCRSGHVQ
jgi:tRNA (guanine-N(7)-)-methyltransferase subunit TRM82